MEVGHILNIAGHRQVKEINHKLMEMGTDR